jgi:hypothetical protein
MMNIVESSDLGEHPSKRFLIMLSEINSPSPVITPFDHRSWFQDVTTDFIDIVSISLAYLWPVAERKQELTMATSEVC